MTLRWLRAQRRRAAGQEACGPGGVAAARCFETADLQIDSAGRLCFHPAAGIDEMSEFDASAASVSLGDSMSRDVSRSSATQQSGASVKSLHEHAAARSPHAAASSPERPHNHTQQTRAGAGGGWKASSAIIRELLDERPPSPRYDESFLVAASYAPMSQVRGLRLLV